VIAGVEFLFAALLKTLHNSEMHYSTYDCLWHSKAGLQPQLR